MDIVADKGCLQLSTYIGFALIEYTADVEEPEDLSIAKIYAHHESGKMLAVIINDKENTITIDDAFYVVHRKAIQQAVDDYRNDKMATVDANVMGGRAVPRITLYLKKELVNGY